MSMLSQPIATSRTLGEQAGPPGSNQSEQIRRPQPPPLTIFQYQKGYKVKGIAIALNLLSKHLDALGIEHDSPAIVRKDLQRREMQ